MHGYSLNPVQSQKYALNTKEPAEPQSEMAGVLFFGLVRSVSHCWITPNLDRLALLVRAFLFWRLTMDRHQLKSQLERHEGLRLKPYRDTVGELTVGYGRNLDDVGIRPEEAALMLDNDITEAE